MEEKADAQVCDRYPLQWCTIYEGKELVPHVVSERKWQLYPCLSSLLLVYVIHCIVMDVETTLYVYRRRAS